MFKVPFCEFGLVAGKLTFAANEGGQRLPSAPDFWDGRMRLAADTLSRCWCAYDRLSYRFYSAVVPVYYVEAELMAFATPIQHTVSAYAVL